MRISFIKLWAEWRKTRRSTEALGFMTARSHDITSRLKKQGQEGLLHPRESHMGAWERPAHGDVAFNRETEPLPTWGQQGGRQGIYAWSFLSSCWAIPASVSYLSNPIRSQSPGAVQTWYPSRWASWGMGQGGGEAEVRNGLVENEWPYYQPLFIINFHLHLEEGEKSDRIQEMILCEGDRSLEYVLRAVIHIFFLSQIVFQI